MLILYPASKTKPVSKTATGAFRIAVLLLVFISSYLASKLPYSLFSLPGLKSRSKEPGVKDKPTSVFLAYYFALVLICIRTSL